MLSIFHCLVLNFIIRNKGGLGLEKAVIIGEKVNIKTRLGGFRHFLPTPIHYNISSSHKNSKHNSKRRSTAGCFSYGNVCGRTHVFGSRECFGCRSCSLQVSRILVINLDLNVLKYFCLIIDSFAALKIEARDFKYFIVHLQIHIGIDHGTPMVQLVLFQRTK